MDTIIAHLLAKQITEEIPDTNVVVGPDEYLPSTAESYHIDVYRQKSLLLCIRSEEQWNTQKGLLNQNRENAKQ
jgi:esterase/lipase superfamily enzyme